MKFDLARLRSSHQLALFLLDIIMMVLIIVNLVWLVFDTLFASHMIQTLLVKIYPELFGWYRDEVHPDFIAYDLIFVWIFVTELVVRWSISVYSREYHRWWFYPFIHWYDVLGCIPIGPFRSLRLFRVVSIILRLHKFGIIDLRQSSIARFVDKYVKVIVEEVSDRVVVNVLENVKLQVKEGNPVAQRVISQVIRPRDRIIAQWIGNRLREALEQSYYPREDDVESYVDRCVAQAIQESRSLHRYSQVPLLGARMEAHLYKIVSEVVFNVIHQVVEDLHSEDTTELIHESATLFLDHLKAPDSEMSILIQSIVVDVIDVIIDEVKIQKWKLEESHV